MRSIVYVPLTNGYSDERYLVSTDTGRISKSHKECDRVPRTRGQSIHLQCYPNHAHCTSLLNGLTLGRKLTKVASRGLDVSLERPGVVCQA